MTSLLSRSVGFILSALLSVAHAQTQPRQIIDHYADVAQAMFEDALSRAQNLQTAVAGLIEQPNELTLIDARFAWLEAREPYQQTEALRFGNAIVDDWEGRVNAWPLDEGFIDYVDASYADSSDQNPLYRLNVIANSELRIGSRIVDATLIDKALLADELHQAQGVESNVATGYHAIEFLLWGQDLNGINAGAGSRPASDFDSANCSNKHCQRRAQYLNAVTELLVDDLSQMVAYWQPGGEAREALAAKDDNQGLATILTGIANLSYAELAGDRVGLGLKLHDPEEEHDCFSDNTHNSHFYNQIGMLALYQGRYQRIDGSLLTGPSLAELAEASAPQAAKLMDSALQDTLNAMQVMKDMADSGQMAYDQMIGAGNVQGNRIIQTVVDRLIAQTRAAKALADAFSLPIEIEAFDEIAVIVIKKQA